MSKWYTLGVSLLAGYISFTHRENLVRILKGKEPKIGKDALLQMMDKATKILGRLSK
ncbi:hypothetical protein IH981_03990 [Patescibacteria group bacterium]|nr:hypothetical protein [Patescibacteria group bacterium]